MGTTAMKTALGVFALVILGQASAVAADMPVKAPATPVYNWTGCYAGINGGAAASGSDFHSNVDPGTHFTDPGDVGPGGTVATAGTGSAKSLNADQISSSGQTLSVNRGWTR